MKSLKIFFLNFLLCSTFSLNLLSADGPNNGALPPLTAEDLQAMEELMKNLSQEELDQLAELGRQEIAKAEAEGRDLVQELFGVPADVLEQEIEGALTPGEIPQAPVEEPKSIAIPETAIAKPCPEAQQCRQMFKHLAELISSIEQKAQEQRSFADQLKPWKYHFQDITYFAHALSEDKLLKYMTEKEFAPLVKTYSQLEQELSTYEPLFIVPESEIEGVNPYVLLGTTTDASWQDVNVAYQKAYSEKHPKAVKQQLEKEHKPEAAVKKAEAEAQKEIDTLSNAYNAILQKEQAQQALNNILDSLSRAIYVNNIIAQSKKVLERYEPDALKIKEQQEEYEKKARKEQEEALRRRPSYTPPIFERPLPPRYHPSTDEYGYPAANGGYEPSGGSRPGKPGLQPTKPESKQGPSGGAGAPGKKEEKKEGEKKGEGKKEEVKKGMPSEDRRMTNKLKAIEGSIDKIKEIFETPDIMGELPRNYFKNKEEFQGYLQKDLKDKADYEKAALINKQLTDITLKLNNIKAHISDEGLKGFSMAQKKEIKDKAQKIFNEAFDLEKGELGKKLKGLLALPTERVEKDKKVEFHLKLPVSPSIEFMHLGGNPEKLRTKIDDQFKKIRTSDISFINQFLDVYHHLKNQLRKTQ